MQGHQDHRSICVIGSLNVDQCMTLPRFHQPGETITGSNMHTYAGGKGGNQAVAAARLGADVRFIGMLGDDANGSLYRRVLRKEHVDCSGIRILKGMPTGVAFIEVDAQGENRIAVVPGANAMLEAGYVCAMLQHMPENALYMMQLEVPLDTVTRAARCIRERGGTLLLDPAPAVKLEDELLEMVDILTPNEHELKVLTGLPAGTVNQAELAARSLLKRGVGAVVAKLGKKGCVYVDNHTKLRAPGYTVQAVDTTAAGDTFNAGLAVALSRGLGMTQALQVANAAGALSVTQAGAQAAMPDWAQVQQLISAQAAHADPPSHNPQKGQTMTTLICYRRCSTCRKLEKTLQDKGHPFDYREIDANNPTAKELARWHKQSGLPLKRFFNTSGMKYRELGLAKKLPGMTDEEQYALLATDGLLVKRPIVLTADQVYVGPDAVKWGDSL